jgi:hypothetical protein
MQKADRQVLNASASQTRLKIRKCGIETCRRLRNASLHGYGAPSALIGAGIASCPALTEGLCWILLKCNVVIRQCTAAQLALALETRQYRCSGFGCAGQCCIQDKTNASTPVQASAGPAIASVQAPSAVGIALRRSARKYPLRCAHRRRVGLQVRQRKQIVACGITHRVPCTRQVDKWLHSPYRGDTARSSDIPRQQTRVEYAS